ncbi:MAG: electron transport complex subunit RsxC [Planctomycetes bacterium]|nr:electron transport complex subunit RsxC [Planctomycetota bacterium]
MNYELKNKQTFAGGIHPKSAEKLAKDCKIEPFPVPKQVAVMLSQHIGAICKPLVKKGDDVKIGQKIGETDAFVSAAVHSPVNGKVKDIALQSHVVAGRSKAIIIETDLENNPQKQLCKDKFNENFSAEKYSAEEICNAVNEAGIVGLGGAGFPTRVKLEPNPRLPKKTLIINGCECEPCITGDYRIMLEWTNQMIAGVKLAKKASGCSDVFIGIEDNKPKAIKTIIETLEKSSNNEKIKVVPLETKYPQGGERQLIKAVLGINVPTGGIPPMLGVVVLNVATAAAIAEAVVEKAPLTHRVVTITGKTIAKPANYYVPIGTAVNELLEFAGGVTEKSAKVVLGGPMMGIAIADLTTPVTKTTGAVTVLTKQEIGKAKFACQQTACIRCGRCLEVCPEHLNPTKIAHAVKNDMLDVAEDYYIKACIECGCCSYICPANIEVAGYIKTGKIFLARQK